MSAEDHGWEVLKEFEDGTQIVRDPAGIGGMPLAITEDPENGDFVWFAEGDIPELVATIAAAFDVAVNPRTVEYANGVDPDASLNEQLLQVAINNGAGIAFQYAKGDGAVIETRHLQPVKLDEVRGQKIVTGFDPDRDDIRAYRLDRIKGTVKV